jgi:hypothetical protein
MITPSPEEAERVGTAWAALTGWLAEHAPVSHASLLPPAPDEEIALADTALRQHLGYGLPGELVALWRLCGGVAHRYIAENEEDGEVGSGAFLPDGVLLSPRDALRPRLPETGARDYWDGAPVVPWCTGDEAGPEYGLYAGPGGVGRWSTSAGPYVSPPGHPSLAAYLTDAHRALTGEPAHLPDAGVPGIVWGCLVWDDPAYPRLEESRAHWTPLFPVP